MEKHAAKDALSRAKRAATNDLYNKLNKNNDGRYIYRLALAQAIATEVLVTSGKSRAELVNY